MSQSCHDSDLGINFLTEISPHEVSWDEHRSDAESVKILYNYSVELSKYADRINGCSGIWNLELIPIRKISSQASVFAVSVIALCVSGADLYSGGRLCFSIAKYSGTFSYPSLGISNPNREKPTCYRIAWPWSTWMIHGSDWLKPSGFKSGVAGFLRTTEVTRGEWWRHDGTSAFPCLVVG